VALKNAAGFLFPRYVGGRGAKLVGRVRPTGPHRRGPMTGSGVTRLCYRGRTADYAIANPRSGLPAIGNAAVAPNSVESA
jgi:hypothetical protein